MSTDADGNSHFKTKYIPKGVPKLDPELEKKLGFDRETEGLTFMQRRQKQQKLQWDKYWEIRDKEAEGGMGHRVAQFGRKWFVDKPATWFRETVVEPLHDRYRMPYYQRRLDRVPEIDQCGVLDRVCVWEANEQYRLDKMVDSFILKILRERIYTCMNQNRLTNMWVCSNVLDDYEENELNFFIKYGEIGSEGDVVDAYMKQKHRLIWERRHPAIMAERKRLEEDHKKAVEEGKFDLRFWSKFTNYNEKHEMSPLQIYKEHWKNDKLSFEADQPISKDWRYYKKLSEDPSFDVRNYPPWLNEAARKAKEIEENGNAQGG